MLVVEEEGRKRRKTRDAFRFGVEKMRALSEEPPPLLIEESSISGPEAGTARGVRRRASCERARSYTFLGSLWLKSSNCFYVREKRERVPLAPAFCGLSPPPVATHTYVAVRRSLIHQALELRAGELQERFSENLLLVVRNAYPSQGQFAPSRTA